MGNAGHKMLGKELKLRGNRKKRLKVVRKIVSHLFAYSGAIFAPPGRFFGYSGAILERLGSPFSLSTAAQNMHRFRRKSSLHQKHFFGQLKTAFLLTDCEKGTLKNLLSRAFVALDVHL